MGDSWRITVGKRTLDWPLPTDGRLVVVGAGKACASLAKGLETVLGDRIHDGCIITKYGHCEILARIRQFEAGHPLPDEAGLAATRELIDTVSSLTEKDCVVVLLTGGASSLLVAPAEGVTLEEKAAVTEMLLRSRASIEEINSVRARLSRVKGGRLLDHIAPASVLTLLLSDVPSGDCGAIGSGPTVRSRNIVIEAEDVIERYGLRASIPPAVRKALASKPLSAGSSVGPHNEAVVVGDHNTLFEAVKRVAEREGLPLVPVDLSLRGDTHTASHRMIAALKNCPRPSRPALFVSAGETTLEVTGPGKGGRNQEFALTAAIALEGINDAVLLAAGTDGTDGPTDAAGAFADGDLCARARSMGYDPVKAIADNDSYPLLSRTGDLLKTGPTGTNLMDLVLGLAF